MIPISRLPFLCRRHAGLVLLAAAMAAWPAAAEEKVAKLLIPWDSVPGHEQSEIARVTLSVIPANEKCKSAKNKNCRIATWRKYGGTEKHWYRGVEDNNVGTPSLQGIDGDSVYSDIYEVLGRKPDDDIFENNIIWKLYTGSEGELTSYLKLKPDIKKLRAVSSEACKAEPCQRTIIFYDPEKLDEINRTGLKPPPPPPSPTPPSPERSWVDFDSPPGGKRTHVALRSGADGRLTVDLLSPDDATAPRTGSDSLDTILAKAPSAERQPAAAVLKARAGNILKELGYREGDLPGVSVIAQPPCDDTNNCRRQVLFLHQALPKSADVREIDRDAMTGLVSTAVTVGMAAGMTAIQVGVVDEAEKRLYQQLPWLLIWAGLVVVLLGAALFRLWRRQLVTVPAEVLNESLSKVAADPSSSLFRQPISDSVHAIFDSLRKATGSMARRTGQSLPYEALARASIALGSSESLIATEAGGLLLGARSQAISLDQVLQDFTRGQGERPPADLRLTPQLVPQIQDAVREAIRPLRDDLGQAVSAREVGDSLTRLRGEIDSLLRRHLSEALPNAGERLQQVDKLKASMDLLLGAINALAAKQDIRGLQEALRTGVEGLAQDLAALNGRMTAVPGELRSAVDSLLEASRHEAIGRELSALSKKTDDLPRQLVEASNDLYRWRDHAAQVETLAMVRLGAPLKDTEGTPAAVLLANAPRWQWMLREGLHGLGAVGEAAPLALPVLTQCRLEGATTMLTSPNLDRLAKGLAAEAQEAFLAEWNESAERFYWWMWFKLRFYLDNMLVPLAGPSAPGPLLAIRDAVVGLTDALRAGARTAGVVIHDLSVRTDASAWPEMIERDDYVGAVTQALRQDSSPHREAFQGWLLGSGRDQVRIDWVVEPNLIGYTLAGETRAVRRSRVTTFHRL